MAVQPDDWVSEDLLSPEDLWLNLSKFDSGSNLIKHLDAIEANFPQLYFLMLFWEWLRVLRRRTSSNVKSFTNHLEEDVRLSAFSYDRDSEVRPSYYLSLWNGYILAMERAISDDEIDVLPSKLSDHLPQELAPLDRLASNLLSLDPNKGFSIYAAPPHVGLLVLPFLRLRKGRQERLGKGREETVDRGIELQEKYMHQWQHSEAPTTVNSPSLILKNWQRGRRGQAQRGIKDSPTARLIRAVAIEKYLISIGRSTWNRPQEAKMSGNPLTGKLLTPQELGHQIGLGAGSGRAKTKFMNQQTSSEQLELSNSVAVTWPDNQLLFTCTIQDQEWMSVDFMDTSAVIQVKGWIGGQRHSEIVFGKVIDMRDHASQAGQVEVDICALGTPAKLMNYWAKANPDERNISCLATVTSIQGKSRLVFGVDAYLGEQL